VIDWDMHCRCALALLRSRRHILVPQHRSIRLRTHTECWYIEPLARLLGSRHIPDTVRAQFPRIAWQLTARLASYLRRVGQGTWPLRPDLELIRDFNRRYAPQLVREIRKMRLAMARSDIDANRRDGILAQETSGRFLHVTLRIPAHTLDDLRRFLDDAYANEVTPTVGHVRDALGLVTRQLRALGVATIYVFGSVARGEASAASDIDIAYQLRGPIDLDGWMEINRLLETALGKVIDAHRIEPREMPPQPFYRVWPRRQARRRITPNG
jgi:predicted nucleotidyltransferase